METNTPTKIDNIKELYSQVIDRDDFIPKISNEFEIAESTALTNWFSKYEIPSRHKIQDNVIVFMQNYINNQ